MNVMYDHQRVVKTLAAIKELLATPNKWTKKASARTARGRIVNVDDPDAYCFCIGGALRKISDCDIHLHFNARHWIWRAIRNRSEYTTMSTYNDSDETSFLDIHSLIDEAIEECEKDKGRSEIAYSGGY